MGPSLQTKAGPKLTVTAQSYGALHVALEGDPRLVLTQTSLKAPRTVYDHHLGPAQQQDRVAWIDGAEAITSNVTTPMLPAQPGR